MKIFLYEFVTGGGCWSGDVPLDGSLLAEARAMVRAVAFDYEALDGVAVFTTRDARLPELHPAGCQVTLIGSGDEEQAVIHRLAGSVDWTMLIAPETGGALLERSRLVEQLGGCLLSPASTCIEIATSKQATAERLNRRGVQVPRGMRLSAESRELPADLI